MKSNDETVSRQTLWACNIAKSMTSEGNCIVFFYANVDRPPPWQRGLLNIQGPASGDIETFEKQNELFSLEPVIKY